MEYAKDPRNNTLTIFAPERMKRPQMRDVWTYDGKEDCSICKGNTTKVILSEEISTGMAFVNTNMYPFLKEPDGLHLLVWPNSNHDLIQCMNYKDFSSTFGLLRELDKSDSYLNVIKNTGKSAGGSLSHEHYQATLSDIVHKTLFEDIEFKEIYGQSFGRYLIENNPKELTIEEGRVSLLTPFYMKRPFNTVQVVEAPSFKELSDKDCEELAKSTIKITKALSRISQEYYSRELNYNVVFHSGVGCLYSEIYPILQSEGGFEKTGIYVCEASPLECSEILKRKINLS